MRPSRGQLAQERAQPQHPLGVEAVGGLVEDEHLGIAEERGPQRESLLHAGRVALDRALGGALELDELERLVHARVGDAGPGGDHAQGVAPGAAGVEAGGVEERADPCGGRVQLPVAAAEDRHRSRRGPHEVEDHAQGGGLAGAVGSEHAGDGPRLDDEAHVVDRQDLLAEALGQVLGLDDCHGASRSVRARIALGESTRGARLLLRAAAPARGSLLQGPGVELPVPAAVVGPVHAAGDDHGAGLATALGADGRRPCRCRSRRPRPAGRSCRGW